MRLALLASVLALAGGRAGSGGVTVALPAGWHALRQPPPIGHIVDPVTRVVVSSGPIWVDSHGCLFGVYSFPRTAVEVIVVEWTSLFRRTTWHPRPARFTVRNLPLRPAPAVECFDGPAATAEFVDHGHRLGVYVLLGRDAPRSLVAKARSVLDTLRER
jgi:hypothetical protein